MTIRRFKLSESFIEPYKTKEVPWGPVGYPVYKRTYARKLSEFEPNATGTEEWWQTCRRVIEGEFYMQKQHVVTNGLPWNDAKAQNSAKEAYDLLFHGKWTPPGRGLWMMGSKFVEERLQTGLFNCGFRSTKELSTKHAYIFSWIMDALMVGVGVGFDTKGAGTVTIQAPKLVSDVYLIPDTREGWVESVKILLNGYLIGSEIPQFDFSLIRGPNEPIKGFGGVSSGPQPLIDLHRELTEIYTAAIGTLITSTIIVDTCNLIGKCVVAGNVRRCLPKNTLVTTDKGLEFIQDIQPGTKVLGPDKKYHSVTRMFEQGKQQLYKIITEDGEIRSTINHRWAVLTKPNQYIWKTVDQLNPNDRIVFSAYATNAEWWTGSIEEENSFTSHQVKLITLDAIEETYDIEVADVHCFWANGYLSHNSAEIALGEKDDREFVLLKQDPAKLENHRWCSNNTIFADIGMDYSWHAEQTRKNGEPGYFWLENARHYGRMQDGKKDDDLAVMGVNPCVTADTWVATDQGYKQVKELINNNNWKAHVNGKLYSLNSNGFWKTGTKNVFLLTTKEGYEVKLTSDHQVLTQRGWVKAKDLNTYDKIVLNNHRKSQIPPSANDFFQEGLLMGLLVGDGTFAKQQPVLSFWDEKLLNSVTKQCTKYQQTFKSPTQIPDRNEFRVKKPAITSITNNYHIQQGSKHNIEHLISEDQSFVRGFIRGIFDTDGTVIGDQKKGLSVRLCQSNLPVLKTVQRMLLRFGITCTIYQNRNPSGMRPMPDGHGGSKLYFCQATHELVISSADLIQFSQRIGFSPDTDKNTKLQYGISRYRRTPNRTKFEARFNDLQYLGQEDVYDVTVDQVHAFDANGLYLHNCSEQILEDAELCCLCEIFISKHESFEELKRSAKLAYLYAKTVTLSKTQWPETNQKMHKNRRIGLSLTGIVQAFNKFGRRTVLNWCDELYQYIQDLDKEYSDWLCIPRSKRTTSIKPSGSVSKLFGVTPGCHYPEHEHYIQRIRFSNNSELLPLLLAAGYPHEPCIYSPNTTVIEFPIKEPYFEKGKADVSMWEQLEIAAQLQYYWADNSVSVTVTFHPEEANQIHTALQLYETRLKAVSFLQFKETGYKQAPMEPISEEEYLNRIQNITPLQRAHTNEDGEGTRYCTNDSCEIDFSSLLSNT